ncbi:hypothetical protein SAMN06269173_103520 [Hymenobacter mucosus]|uniref:Uncharacterized protein n=1 Tax=Hymenobacter mucosus TaxID=1411120 RepID=A0A238X6R2_9BACT|nr:hypothetical protein SAMN06269173_103520 [Hymenobacter mucosus]
MNGRISKLSITPDKGVTLSADYCSSGIGLERKQKRLACYSKPGA